jgi:hypothetical protein
VDHSPEAQGVAVLLAPEAGAESKANPSRVLEVFTKPEQIEALRAMVRIVALPSEKQRLLELRERSGSPIFRAQFPADLRDLREPANFSLLLDLCLSQGEVSAEAPKTLYQKVSWLRRQGDEKAAQALFEQTIGAAQPSEAELEPLVRWETEWLERMIESHPQMQTPIRRALLPLSDFWTGDRASHHWIMLALAHLRVRHGHGVNGPLQKL